MAKVVEYLSNDGITGGTVTAEEKKKLVVTDDNGRARRVPADKVLFHHDVGSPALLARQREELMAEIDVELLWETALEEAPGGAFDPAELARIYFDADSSLHCSAIYHALLEDRLRFRKRGRTFQPRSAEDLAQLREQKAAEERRAAEEAALRASLDRAAIDEELASRIERWLRGQDDKVLHGVLESKFRDAPRKAFALLVRQGFLDRTADLEVVQANLRAGYPEAALEHAAALVPPPVTDAPSAALFSIDDLETREVDDVLSVRAEDGLIRVDVDIADVSALVRPDDPLDREAQRRASTAYMPTGTYYMLPERIGCDLASLHAEQPRYAVRTSVWLDADGAVKRHELSRVAIRVDRRLDYDTADALIAAADPDDATTRALLLLQQVAAGCRQERQQAGAISFQRPEWKIRVSEDGEEVVVTPLSRDSASRRIVEEMMILTNRLAAETASSRGVPIIFRVQPPPTGPLPELDPEDPAFFEKLRGQLQPASLSLEPGWHWGLGVRAYTQVTSPLRRYADLVAQRQLLAALADEPLPYDARELLRVLANAESTERELKRVEAAVTERWALEAVERLEHRSGLTGRVVAEAPGGYKVQLDLCGAVGRLTLDARLALGDPVTVNVERVDPRAGVLRLQLAG